MITYQEETYNVIFTPEYRELMLAHYREVGGFRNSLKIKLAPNWDMYRLAGKNGNIAMFTARNDEVLVGYIMFILAPHPHYRNATVADNDSLYLDPEHRKGLAGYKFIKYCVEKLKKKADIITLSSKADKSFSIITKRLGFELTDYKFTLEV